MTLGSTTRRRLLVIVIVSVLWILVAGYVVARHPDVADDADHNVGIPFARFADAHDFVEQTAEVVAVVFRPVWVLACTVVAGIIAALRGLRRTAAWFVSVALLCELTTVVMKAAFDRPRPTYAHMQLQDASFPSGHSSVNACVAGIVIVLSMLFVRRRTQRRLVAVAGIAVALVIGMDRLLLGVHGITDVVTGYALAAFWVAGSAYLVDPTPRMTFADPLPTVLPRTRDLAVILNPSKFEDPATFRALVDARAIDLGWNPPVWFETTVEDPGRSMAHRAALGGAELVLVCGGDGTVRTVCAELAGTGIPVGVVPAGTGNLLARNLGLPLFLGGALDVALGGQDRAIDIVRIAGDGIADGEHFLVMAGMGFDAAIMEGATEQIKAKVGWLAYVVAGVRNLMFPAIRVEVAVDDRPATRHRARTIVVGNVGFLQAGLPLLPDATIDDGRLDVVLINPRRSRHWLLVVGRVVTRGKKLDETVNRMTGRKILIRAAVDAPRQVDGDPIGAGRELVCECLPGKLLVRVAR